MDEQIFKHYVDLDEVADEVSHALKMAGKAVGDGSLLSEFRATAEVRFYDLTAAFGHLVRAFEALMEALKEAQRAD